MARAFDSASTDYLSRAGAVVTGYPFSVLVRFKPTDITTSGYLFCITDASSDLTGFSVAKLSTGKVWAEARAGGSRFRAQSTTLYTAGVWQYAFAIFASATKRIIYLDGGGKATSVGSMTPNPAVLDTTSIGDYLTVGAENPYDGDLSETFVWATDFSGTEDEIAARLASGVSPRLVAPEFLQNYWPMDGNISPETDWYGGADLTLTGTSKANNPRIAMPSAQIIQFPPPAVVGGVTIPVLRRRIEGY